GYKLKSQSVDESGIYYCKVNHQDIPDFYIPTKQVSVTVHKKIFEALPMPSIETYYPGITSTNWVDVDNDGDEDLFVANRDYDKSGLYINKTKETGQIFFEKSTFESLYTIPLSLCTSTWADFNNDGLEDLAAFSDHWINGQGSASLHLFENLGNYTFDKKEIEISINKTLWEVLKGACWADLNHDNLLDMAVGYEEWTPNVGALYRGRKLINNNGVFTADLNNYYNYAGEILFSDILKEKGTELILSQGFLTIWKEGNWQNELFLNPTSGTGVPSLGDFDNDGDLDIFSPVSNVLVVNPNPQNCFLENVAGNFIERKDLSPTFKAIPGTSGSVCFDVDNDGDLDLAVSNANATNEMYKNLLMETGTLTFEPVDDVAFENEVGIWVGVSTIDIDMDGYQDLSKVTPTGVYLSRNKNAGNNWLSVKCNGVVSNGSAIGAKVYAVATINGKKVTQYREILAASGKTSVTSRRLHFGLGNASKIDSLIVKWPSGINNLFVDVDVNKFMDITESTNQVPVANAGSDQMVKTGDSVILDGLASYDYNGKGLSYKWMAPDEITLINSTTATPSFTAPVSRSNKIYTFTLVVNNGINDSPIDEVSITVKGDRNLPVANAGSALVAREGEVVTLDGSASSDGDMDPLTYLWTAPLGILLNSNVSVKPYFTAPQVKNDSVLSFSLIVNDGSYSSSLSTVKVTVLNVIPVGNATVNAPAFRVYPNPTEGMVYVETSAVSQRMIKVSLCDLMGNELSGKEMIVHSKFKLDLSYLTSGVYFLKITDKDLEYISKIMIKK
ncbi:MAG: FG-GAP-like repeat-containing protein, partial [Candidatus Saccharibacteria bacterium]